jgi:lysophospholipase L1-like esterase
MWTASKGAVLSNRPGPSGDAPGAGYGRPAELVRAARPVAHRARRYYVPTERWLTSTDLTDGTHPNDGGHRKVAARLAPLIAAKI